MSTDTENQTNPDTLPAQEPEDMEAVMRAFKTITKALGPLPQATQERVIRAAAILYCVSL